MKKRITKIIILFTAVTAVIFITASCSSVNLPRSKQADSYIKENAVPLPITESTILSGLPAGDTEDLYTALDAVYSPYTGTKRVIFIGEKHACAGNFVVLHRLFPYFIDRFSVTAYVSEKGVAEGYLLDTYLKTGDESIPRRLIEMVSSSAAYTNDQMESFRILREQYLALPEEERFRFIGIDVGHALSAPIMAFHYMTQDLSGDPPPPLEKAEELYRQYMVDGFPGFGDSRQDDVIDLMRNLDESLTPGSDLEIYLGDSSAMASLIIDSVVAAYDFYNKISESGYDAAGSLRETAIMDHFTRHHNLAENPESEIYFGQWGGFHVHQQPLAEEETIAGMINAPDGPFTGEVLSTMIFYNNCYYRDRKSNSGKQMDDSPGAYLGQRITDNYALIPLDLPGSPFSEAVYFIYNSDKLDGVTTDYIQAALLIQNAPAAETYNGN
ncbi:MAG: hypothetical protein ACLFST_04525 [Spirochaetia bacterium]